MSDPTEAIRRAMIEADIPAKNALEDTGPKYNTEQVQEHFVIHGFLAPFVSVTRKSDGKKGTLQFVHSPRIYFSFEPE